MKISYKWLKDYVDIKKTPDQLAEDLSLFGHEVESMEKFDGDYVLDLEITPNRGDCLSILGIAREISALYNLKLKTKNLKPQLKTEKLNKKIKIDILDPKICPRFTARIIDEVKIGESPEWMQKRLASYGFRPVNNIVDITNYVMIATGQPLHAFDYDKINNGLMRIRQSKAGEEVMTLDGKNHILPDNAIIIEDAEKIYDLAGIMGGFKSEVDENTKTIILQGAIFDPILIRRASKYLNHTTDASYRYERGVDFEGAINGVDTATKLILESCPQAKSGELIDKKIGRTEDLPRRQAGRRIRIEIEKINKLLGIEVNADTGKEYLERLRFKVEGNTVTVPSYRQYDVKIWQDLAEEIARLYGYNRIKKAQMSKSKTQQENEEFNLREYIKDVLVEAGFTEIYSYSFAKKEELEKLGFNPKDWVEVANPLSPETQYLRPSLPPSILSMISKNPWAPDIKIFEIGKVFPTENREMWQLGIAVSGKNEKEISEVAKNISEKIDVNFEFQVCRVDQAILDFYKIRRPVIYGIIDLEDITSKVGKVSLKYQKTWERVKFKPFSRFSPTVRDIAFIVSQEVSSDDVAQSIKEISNKILLVELFDEFASPKFGKNKKNLAYHIWLQDLEKTLKDSEVQKISAKIAEKVKLKYNAKLRDF